MHRQERVRQWYAAAGVLFVCGLSLFFYVSRPMPRPVNEQRSAEPISELASRADNRALRADPFDAQPGKDTQTPVARPQTRGGYRAESGDVTDQPDVLDLTRNADGSSPADAVPADSDVDAAASIVQAAAAPHPAPLVRNVAYDAHLQMAAMPSLQADGASDGIARGSHRGAVTRAFATAGRQTARGFKKVGSAFSKVF